MSWPEAAVIISIIGGVVTAGFGIVKTLRNGRSSTYDQGVSLSAQLSEFKAELKFDRGEHEARIEKRLEAIEDRFLQVDKKFERLTGLLFSVLKDRPSDAQL